MVVLVEDLSEHFLIPKVHIHVCVCRTPIRTCSTRQIPFTPDDTPSIIYLLVSWTGVCRVPFTLTEHNNSN